MAAEIRRKTPEEYLRECQAEEDATAASDKGHLKIFLGYASGVGKSFRMLDEGRRRSERGQDVVIGAVQPSLPLDLAQPVSSLEIIPVKQSKGVAVMDVPAILLRAPKVCLVDGLAYDNPPGSVHEK